MIRGEEIAALLDTGCEVSILNEQLYYKYIHKNPSNTTKGDLLLHKVTSFDPTVGSSSGQ
jgi:hypothetical protein